MASPGKAKVTGRNTFVTAQCSRLFSSSHPPHCIQQQVYPRQPHHSWHYHRPLPFQHIILAVAHVKKSGERVWGAVGLSRADTLMYKPLKHESFGELLLEYKTAYENESHSVLNIYVGLPFSHAEYSQQPIQWRVLDFKLENVVWADVAATLEKFADDGMNYLNKFLQLQKLPDEMVENYSGFLLSSIEKVGPLPAASSPKKRSRSKKSRVTSPGGTKDKNTASKCTRARKKQPKRIMKTEKKKKKCAKVENKETRTKTSKSDGGSGNFLAV